MIWLYSVRGMKLFEVKGYELGDGKGMKLEENVNCNWKAIPATIHQKREKERIGPQIKYLCGTRSTLDQLQTFLLLNSSTDKINKINGMFLFSHLPMHFISITRYF